MMKKSDEKLKGMVAQAGGREMRVRESFAWPGTALLSFLGSPVPFRWFGMSPEPFEPYQSISTGIDETTARGID
jgi:hypothetical protein